MTGSGDLRPLTPSFEPAKTKPNPKCRVDPFLRWAGGKRWLAQTLAPQLNRRLAQTNGVYLEPFMGSAAMFFAVAPRNARMSDVNFQLVETFRTVATDAAAVLAKVMSWPVDADTYYSVRAMDLRSPIDAAARFIYLNRTCYGGLHRTNREGRFNTPFGGGSRTPEALWRDGVLLNCADRLSRDVEIFSSDFEALIDSAGAGDVVYCDPTYSNPSRDHFDRYGELMFAWKDQVRLAFASRRAMERGALVIVSNGAYDEVAELYPDAYRIRLSRRTSLGRVRRRGTDDEFLLVMDPTARRERWKELGEIENRRKRRPVSSSERFSTIADVKRNVERRLLGTPMRTHR